MFRGITFRIAAVFTAVMLLMSLTASGIFLYLYSSYAVSDKQDTLFFCAQDISRLISDEKASAYEYSAGTELSRYTTFVESVVHAKVWVMYDTGIFRRDNISGGSPLHIKELTPSQSIVLYKGLKGQPSVTNEFSSYFDEEMLTVIYPISETVYSDGENAAVIGVVVVNCPNTALQDAYKSVERFLFFAVVASVLLAIGVSVIVSAKLTKPIRQMRVVARRMTQGDYGARVDEIHGLGEVSELADAFNMLSESLETNIAELKTEKDKVDKMLQNISNGIALFDADMKPLKCNSVLLTIAPYRFYLIPEIRDMMKRTLETEKTESLVTEGETILRYTASAVHDENKTTGVLVVVQDISYSERLERTRRDFVSNVSHEFRTPLTIIKGSVELLVEGALTNPEDIMKTYQRIDGETQALERLVYDLLDVSRFKSGKMKLKLEPMNVCDVADFVTDGFRIIAEKKRINLVYEANADPMINGDPDRIRQVFVIFLDNAMKFTPEDGTITLSVDSDENAALVRIRDTGVGIAKEEIPFIFERFYKVDKARGGSASGSGLGLSIASSIVEYHGGSIDVESEMGKGTCFTIAIPLYGE